MKFKISYTCMFSLMFILANFSYSQENPEIIFEDNFSQEVLESRTISRGKWSIKENMASSIWSKESAVKTPKGFKRSHRIAWNAEFDNGSIEMQVHTKDIKSILIGMDGKGHICYLTFNEDSFKAVVFPTDKVKGWVKKTNKYATKDIPSIKAFKQNEWTDVKMTTKGNTLQLQIGDYKTTVEDVGFGRHKKSFTFNFTEGEVKIRNVKVTKIK